MGEGTLKIDEKGNTFYEFPNGEKIEPYKEDFRNFCYFTFSYFERFIEIMEIMIEHDESGDCGGAPYLAKEAYENLERRLGEVLDYIHNKLGDIDIYWANEYGPGIRKGDLLGITFKPAEETTNQE